MIRIVFIIFCSLTFLSCSIKKEQIAPSVPATGAKAKSSEHSIAEKTIDAEVTEELTSEAMKKLESNNPVERIEGIEWLYSYPNTQAEAALRHILLIDTSAEVRSAAALSLSGIKYNPSEETITALVTALEDKNDDVIFASLSTLEDFLHSQGKGSPSYQRILRGLEMIANKRGINDDIRDTIRLVIEMR